jgi:TonB-linked SusC/RagA family outer membrane protein
MKLSRTIRSYTKAVLNACSDYARLPLPGTSHDGPVSVRVVAPCDGKPRFVKQLGVLLPARLMLSLLLSALVFFGLNAQEGTKVSGVILDGAGNRLSNIPIGIIGSDELLVFSDESGNFTLINADPDDIIIITPLAGYKPQTLRLNGRDYLKIYLAYEDLESGDDEVKILGINLMKKNIASSISALDLKNTGSSNALSIEQYMQGMVSGLHIVNLSGQSATGAVNFYKGMRSININAQPLYVVDGIPVLSHGVFESFTDGHFHNPLLSVNLFDVSKITVLKDPAYTAAYGSKASNGLVLIETLNPTSVETTIELNLRSGFTLLPDRFIPQLNAHQHKTLVGEMLTSSGMFEESIREQYPVLFLNPSDRNYIDYQHNTNWQEQVFQNAPFSNMNLTVRGGDEIARYGLSLGYLNSETIIRNTDFKRYNLRFVGSIYLFRWLKATSEVAINNLNENSRESARVKETSPIYTALAKSPLTNPYRYDPDGNEISELKSVDELGVSNPVATINNFMSNNKGTQFKYGINLESALSKNLAINSKLGLTYKVARENVFMPNTGMAKYYRDEANNVYISNNQDFNSIYNNTYLLYNRVLNNNHRFTSVSGMNILSNTYQNDWGLTKNAPLNDKYRRLQDGTNNLRELGGMNRKWTWLSFYESLLYSFKDRYHLHATISLDGSSRTGKNADNTIKIGAVPYGLFYSGSLGWRISEEVFLNNAYWLDNLYLRASYGKTGNDDINELYSLPHYNTIRFRQVSGLYPAIYNDRLTYETTREVNAGLDMSLLGYRFSLHADAFRSFTGNLFVYAPVESFLGHNFQPLNDGSMVNSGYSFSVFMRVISGRNFKWDINSNLTTIRNKIIQINDDMLVSPVLGGEIVNMKGHPANSFFGYIYKGVFSTTQEAAEANIKNDKGVYYGAGDAIYADISGPAGLPDGVIDFYDKTIIGSPIPDYFGGVTNTINFRNWQASAFIQFVKGNDVFNYVRYINEQLTGLENQSIKVLNRWQYEGQITDVPKAVLNDPVGNNQFSDRWIEDGSYARFRNLTLSYRIPGEFLAFRNAMIYVSANNLFTFSNYLGYDPEVAYSFGALGQGIDYGMIPQTRSIIMGINVGL